MKKIPLSGKHELALDHYQQSRLRIIVLHNGEEWVCRKESFSKLKQFIQTDHAHIFKGRLQLTKQMDEISIEVKGEKIGVIDVGWLEKNMKQLAAKPLQLLS